MGYIIAAQKLGISPSCLLAAVDRANDAVSALRAGYSHVVLVPENLSLSLMVQGKSNVREFFNQLPTTNPLRRPERMLTVGNLAWIRFAEGLPG